MPSAQQIITQGCVSYLGAGEFDVSAVKGNRSGYRVTLSEEGNSCGCQFHSTTGANCSHITACRIVANQRRKRL